MMTFGANDLNIKNDCDKNYESKSRLGVRY